MDFPVEPFESAGNLKFGMSRQAARSCFAGQPYEFKKSGRGLITTDYFESEGAFLYFDNDSKLEAIEFVLPAEPHFGTLRLLNRNFDAAIQLLQTASSKLLVENDGAIALDIGISIWAPLAKDDPSATVETVLVFRRGYYDN